MAAKDSKPSAKSDKRTDVFDDETGAYTGNGDEKATSSKDVTHEANPEKK